MINFFGIITWLVNIWGVEQVVCRYAFARPINCPNDFTPRSLVTPPEWWWLEGGWGPKLFSLSPFIWIFLNKGHLQMFLTWEQPLLKEKYLGQEDLSLFKTWDTKHWCGKIVEISTDKEKEILMRSIPLWSSRSFVKSMT